MKWLLIHCIVIGVLIVPCVPVCVFQNSYGWKVLCNLRQSFILRLFEKGVVKAFIGGGLEIADEKASGHHGNSYGGDSHEGYKRKEAVDPNTTVRRRRKGSNRQGLRHRFQALHSRPDQAMGEPFRAKSKPLGTQKEIITVHIPPPTPQLKVLLAPQYFFPPKYPNITSMVHGVKYKFPPTNFTCSSQTYLPGMYADEQHGCKIFHVCDMKGRMASYVCPEMTVYDQEILSCNWWFYVNCESSQKSKYMNKYVSESYRRVAAALKVPDRARALDLDYLPVMEDKPENEVQDSLNYPKKADHADKLYSPRDTYHVSLQRKGDHLNERYSSDKNPTSVSRHSKVMNTFDKPRKKLLLPSNGKSVDSQTL